MGRRQRVRIQCLPRGCNPCSRGPYTDLMARGWESKSVEAQQDEAAARSTPEKPRLTPEAAARLREQENLRLSLRRVSQQLEQSHNPNHRAMLEQAQADLERKLQQLSG
jgi:hypothetical protein